MLDLNLNTRELLTYALIYGFCQDGEGYYYGSLEYLSSWLGMSDRTNATRYLMPLVDRGLITKKVGRSRLNQKVCVYMTTSDNGSVIDNPDIDYMIIQPWMMQSMHLNGKDLLLYALIHGYSRKESGNVCEYNKDYFAKWLQCRKDHVERQIKQAINNGFIKKEKDGYVAIVPEGIGLPQTDNTTLDKEDINFTQIDNTFTQIDNIPLPKLTTNNLYLDNLVDNLNIINNNKTKNEIKSKEELSVVVNEIIDKFNIETKEDFDAFKTKEDLDYRLYQKYQKKNPKVDMSLLMKKVADLEYRTILLNKCFEEKRNYEEVFDTVYSTIMLNRFSTYSQAINNLSEKDIRGFVVETDNLFDNSQKNNVWKSKKAYLIGMFQNILDQN